MDPHVPLLGDTTALHIDTMGDSNTCLLAECTDSTAHYPPAVPSLLQWLMIGDSISLQVATHDGFAAEAALRGLQVVHSPGNACGVLRAARCLSSWLEDHGDGGGARWDVITFNFGLHDLSRTPERVELEVDPREPLERALDRRRKSEDVGLRDLGCDLVEGGKQFELGHQTQAADADVAAARSTNAT